MSIFSAFSHIIQPIFSGTHKCLLCHDTTESQAICYDCLNDTLSQLTIDPLHTCPSCGRYSSNAIICGQCQNSRQFTDWVFSSFSYDGTIKYLLHRFKHQKKLEAGIVLSQLMQYSTPPQLKNSNIDLIIPMPLSKNRLLERGFNQSHILAQHITTIRHIPLAPASLIHRRHKPPQSILPANERIKNVHNIFLTRGNVRNCNILLIDDVMTTGATINELAKTLKKSGAHHIYAWSLSRPK